MSIIDWWGTPVVLYIVLAFGLVRWMGKKYIVGDKRTKRLFVQFTVCAIAALIYALIDGQVWVAFSPVLLVMWGVGFLNGIAGFYNWKAQDLSLGKTSVFTIWDDIIAMTLSYMVLHEGRNINSVIGLGILLSTSALMLFVLHAYRAGKRGKATVPVECFYYVGIYSVLWGIAIFTQRYFSHAEVPFSAFSLAWYGGSLVAATGLLFFMHEKEAKQRGVLTPRDVGVTVLYSLLNILCLAIAYWAYKSPQVVVQPINFVSEAILPTAIAFWFFGEKKHFSPVEYLYLAVALTGVMVIFAGYSG